MGGFSAHLKKVVRQFFSKLAFIAETHRSAVQAHPDNLSKELDINKSRQPLMRKTDFYLKMRNIDPHWRQQKAQNGRRYRNAVSRL